MNSDEPTPLTLVCSATGTSLSAIAAKLSGIADFDVCDLEEHLKQIYRSKNDHPDVSMLEICSNNSRQSVLNYWDEAFDSVASELESSSAPSAVLACHLTLFSGRRLEIYTPPVEARIRNLVQPTSKIEDDAVGLNDVRRLKLQRVIVLIDDIYDMYARLQRDDGLYQRSRAIEDYKPHAWKLATGLPSPSNFSPTQIESVILDMDIKNLLRLVAWRRSEMVAAEGLAKAFGVPLTVLSVKHETASLIALCRWPDVKTAYISHKISEPRIENMKSDGRGEHNRWSPFAFEVNRLSGALRRTFGTHNTAPERNSVGVVAIQPTAIDELRFRRNEFGGYLDRYTATLADRWPVPEGAMYTPPNSDAPHLFSMLSNGRKPTSRDGGAISLLQASIYDEIAFRDHLLVSCNQGLLVFRPTALGSRVSGGVRQEISHWTQGTPRPAAMIHLIPEFMAFVDTILDTGRLSSRFRKNFQQHLDTHLESHNLPADATDWIWENCILGTSSPSSISGEDTTDHLGREILSKIDQHFELACQKAIVASIDNQFGVVEKGGGMVAHFMAHDPSEALSHEFTLEVSQFLDSEADELTGAVGIANAKLLSSMQRHFDLESSSDLARLLIGSS